MSIFQDARDEILVGTRLDNYIKNNSNILDEQDPESGLTPLAIAVVGGFPEEVEQLLKKGAKADGLSKNGETSLLLAAWKTTKEQSRIIQQLLQKTPRRSINTTCGAAENKTPLMYAIENKDIDSIKMLRRAGAFLKIKNNDGYNAREMAEDLNDKAVIRALDPDKEVLDLAKLAGVVISFLLYIVAWVNTTLNKLVHGAGLNPSPNPRTNEAVNGTEQPTKDEFVKNIDEFVRQPRAKGLFQRQGLHTKGSPEGCKSGREPGHRPLQQRPFPQNDQGVLVSAGDLLRSSMRHQGRWDNQKKLVQRISKITTQILPEGEGVALRFINQTVNDSYNLTIQEIGNIIDGMSWKSGGNTEIGTYLRSKILEPLVYTKIKDKNLKRPLLISIITDGVPSGENKSTLASVILECGNKLQGSGYPRESVKFMIGQIGTATDATEFLNTLRSNAEIASVTFVTSDKFDAKLADFHANDRELDRWLIETLFSPLTEAGSKKDQ